jgi:hypothetical protein
VEPCESGLAREARDAFNISFGGISKGRLVGLGARAGPVLKTNRLDHY